MSRPSPRGFTLIELLLAAGLSAVLATGVYTTFAQGRAADRRASEDAEARQSARVALDWLARDLESCLTVAGAFNPGLTGASAEFGDQPADTVWFSATSHLPAWRATEAAAPMDLFDPLALVAPPVEPDAPPECDVVQLEYFLGTDPTTDPPGLVRKVRALPTVETSDPASTFATQPLVPDVVGFDVQFWDGSAWVETWDSAESGAFPTAVQLRVVVRVGAPDPDTGWPRATRDFVRTVPLTTGPFRTVTADPAETATGGVR